MIFNGFQARIVLSNHGSLNETFARLRPQQAQQSSATASSEAIADQRAISELLYPLDVSRYSPKVVSSVLDVFRSGAVLLPLAHSSSDAGDEKTARPSIDASASAPDSTIGNVTHAGTEEVKDTTSLYLSFRYVGKRYTSAFRASELDDIANAQLETKQAILLTEDNNKTSIDDDKRMKEGQQQQRRRSEDDRDFYRNCDDDFTANAVFAEEVSTASGNTTSNYREESGEEEKKRRAEEGKSNSLKLGSRIVERFARPSSPAESKENQSTAAELFFDGQLVPLIGIGSASSTKERNLAQRQAEKEGFATAVFKGGGGRIDLSEVLERKHKAGRTQGAKHDHQEDISVSEIAQRCRSDVHTLTLHLWDAMRKDVAKVEKPRSRLLFTGSRQSDAISEAKDLKKIAAPDVIFHFEIHFAHSSTVEKGDLAQQTRSSPNEAISISDRDPEVNMNVLQDGQTSRRSSSNLARHVSPLQSVKEESSVPTAGSKSAGEDAKIQIDRSKELEAMTSSGRTNIVHEGVEDAATSLNVVKSQSEEKFGANDRGENERDKHVTDDPICKIEERDSVVNPSRHTASANKATLHRSVSSPAAAKKDNKGKAREQASHPLFEHSDQIELSERHKTELRVQSAAKTKNEGPARSALRRLAVTFISGLHKASDRERHGRSVSDMTDEGPWVRLRKSLASQVDSEWRHSISVASGLDLSINANDDLWEALKTIRQLRKEHAGIEAERDRFERELQELHLRGIEEEKQTWIKKVQDAREELEHLKQQLERAQMATGPHAK